jgi:hypothetical protein
MPSAGAGSSTDQLVEPGEVATVTEDLSEPDGDELADEDAGHGLVHAAEDTDGPPSDDGQEAEAAPAPVAAKGGGRSRGRGAGGRGKGRGGGRGGKGGRGAAASATADGAAAAAPAVRASKYQWKDASSHTFTPRAEYAGETEPQLSSAFDDLTSKSRPWQFFKRLDRSDDEYKEAAVNSNKYREWRAGHDMDGPDGHRSYPDAGSITETDLRLLDAAILLNGLDPAVSRQHRVYRSDHADVCLSVYCRFRLLCSVLSL